MQKMPQDVGDLIRKKLEQIAIDPFGSHPNLTKLQNREGYRLQVGNWRLIYDLQKEKLVIMVLKVAPRGEVFR